MRKSVKILLIASVIIVIISIPIIFIISNVLRMGQKPPPFTLDNAPEQIIISRNDIRKKLENNTFSLEEDSQIFLDFSQWMANNCPDILNLVKNWKQTVLFEIKNSTYDMWWIIGNNSAIVEVGTNPPQNYGLLIKLDFKTFTEILRQEETPLSAFLKGNLIYEGSFDEALKVAEITNIVSATVMDTYTPAILGGPTFKITVDKSELYEEEGLTLFPCISVTINPDHIGKLHKSLIGQGSVIIVDQRGKIVAKLEDSSHSVHEFINSTTVMMGGQEPGYMQLWNFKENITETLEVPCGHHDLDYNPVSDTFMVLEYIYLKEKWGKDNITVTYDLLSEYNRAGELVWQWDPSIFFPFNATRYTSLGLNETFRGGADWMHSNSFVWDKTLKVIYLNVRNLDTILKINYTTKEVIWDAGRGGDFTLLNKVGEEVDTLFCHPHGFERISSDRYILFDNDLFNQSNPSTMSIENSTGHSRFLEFEIDEENHIMREIWSWVPSNQSYYFPESGGDADRLPNGNTIGIFGDKALILNLRDPVILTEVTKNGTIAWELQIPGMNNTFFWVHRLERFYAKPLITIHDQSIDLSDGFLWINLSTWNTFKQDATFQGIIKIVADGQEVSQESFEFLPHWQPTTFEITVNNLPSNAKAVEIIIENNDGIRNSVIIYEKSQNVLLSYGPVLFLIGSVLVAIPVVIAYVKIKRKRDILEQNTE
ncbi:MAG: aryl-sulfate sulfotransferase [Promethearchaeota archaeon]